MDSSQTDEALSHEGFASRIQAVDLLRGAIVVLMAIDHVRVYSGIPAGGPTPGIFFTRWITHFCAPGFVFLAGTSALLYGQKIHDKGRLAGFLFSRGLLLVILELTLIRLFWTFNLNFSNFMLAGVIWMLGWCMVIFSAFVRLKPSTVGLIGLVIIFGQQIFQYLPRLFPESIRPAVGRIWEFFYPSGFDKMPGIAILYVLIPWIGLMMVGFGFGQLLLRKPETLRRISLTVGLTSIGLFLVAAIPITAYGPAPKGDFPFIFRVLAQQKYPPSQLYLLMTLGPLIALVPFANRAKGKLRDLLIVFGRVPMFFYLLHILLIHCSALLVNLLISGNAQQDWYQTAPFTEIAEDQRWSLGLLYLVYAVDIVILYFSCRWYGKYKATHANQKWLKYL
ncbi:MAG: DUF1624 domain-containing protein [Chitinophagales bacterium]